MTTYHQLMVAECTRGFSQLLNVSAMSDYYCKNGVNLITTNLKSLELAVVDSLADNFD